MSKLLAGRYELVDKIGEGGMAVVYKGKDRLLNRYVAIKILRPEYTKDEKFVESFKSESQAAAGLQHPNIVAVYDVGVAGSINFIVMELVEGKTLSEVIDEQAPMDYKVAIDYAKQMASALALAHKHQIVHRDVKPHNILVTEDGIAKLTDFGIARAVSSSTSMVDTNKIIGSVHYFSPEQARGSYVDERSDIYSLGIVLYEMLTGKVPFDGDNPVEVALKHINEDIVPPSKLVKGVPPNLERLVLKATDKFQTNRYKSADEMLEDLNSVEFVTNYLKDRPDLITAGMPGARTAPKSEQKPVVDPSRKPGGEQIQASSGQTRDQGSDGTNGKGTNGRKKPILLLVIALLILAALIGIIFAGKTGGKQEEVKVPNVLNMTFDEAKAELAKVGLNISRGEDVSSDDVEVGDIAQQLPIEGSNVKTGSIVEVKLSSGPGEIEVPDLKGMTFEEARAQLEARGLKGVKGESRYSDSVAMNLVLTSDPEATKMMKPGETVVLIMSDGPESKTELVPNLYGMEFASESELRSYLQNYSFDLGSMTEEESENPTGSIISQSPAAGETANKGTAIDVVIAKLITDVEIPSFTGKTLGEAEAEANALGLTVIPDYVDDPTGTGTPGTIIGQNRQAGTRVQPGSDESYITLSVIKDRQEPQPEENQGESQGESGGENQGEESGGENSEAGGENNGG